MGLFDGSISYGLQNNLLFTNTDFKNLRNYLLVLIFPDTILSYFIYHVWYDLFKK